MKYEKAKNGTIVILYKAIYKKNSIRNFHIAIHISIAEFAVIIGYLNLILSYIESRKFLFIMPHHRMILPYSNLGLDPTLTVE